MRLEDFLSEGTVVEDLQAKDKESVLREVVGLLQKAGKIKRDKVEEIVAALLKREALGSTGIGKGVAIPHAKCDAVEGLIGAFARSVQGVDFDSLDGEPVRLVFLLVSSTSSASAHLQALAHISKLLRDDSFCKFLREARGRKDILEVLHESDLKVK